MDAGRVAGGERPRTSWHTIEFGGFAGAQNFLRLNPESMTLVKEHEHRAETSAPGRAGWLVPSTASAVLIVLLGLLLRVAYISHESVSGDEAFSITLTLEPLAQVMHKLVLDLVHPPLHYLALRGWLKLFGFGLLQARVLSVIFGTLAIVILYLLAEYLFDRRTALLSALLMAISQLAIMFSQEARPYAQMHFLSLLSAYLFLRAHREGRAVFWWSFVGASTLMLYTNYFGIFLIAALLLVAVVYRESSKLRLWWVPVGAVVGLVLYTPWLASGVVHEALKPGRVSTGTAEYSAVHWWTFLSILNSFNNGKPAGLRSDSPWWAFVVGGLLFTLPLLLLLKKLLATESDGVTGRSRPGRNCNHHDSFSASHLPDTFVRKGRPYSLQRSLRILLRRFLLCSGGARHLRDTAQRGTLGAGRADSRVQRQRAPVQLLHALEGKLGCSFRLRRGQSPARRLRRLSSRLPGPAAALDRHPGGTSLVPNHFAAEPRRRGSGV